MPDFKAFSEKIGVSFNNLNLLVEALTHRSYVNEHPEVATHNERLEFLGDAVLELAVTDFLFKKYPAKPEGELTAYRAALVNTVSLAASGRELGINEHLLLSKGEAKDTGRARDIILANAFEAIVGAIYLDSGFEAAEKFIGNSLYKKIDAVIDGKTYQDAKSRFQESAQDKKGVTPHYESLAAVGPDHDKLFTVAVYLGNREVARGEGKSKQDAEQAAAQNALLSTGW